jgi:hypothetical protein
MLPLKVLSYPIRLDFASFQSEIVAVDPVFRLGFINFIGINYYLSKHMEEHSDSKGDAFQINDLKVLLQVREEELESLRMDAVRIAELNSLLEQKLLAFEQLEHSLQASQKKVASATRREESTEQALLQCLPFEMEYHQINKTLQSREAEINYLQEACVEIRKLSDEMDVLKARLSERESELELIRLDNEYLRDALKAVHTQIPEPFSTL